MTNAFDIGEAKQGEPTRIVAGDLMIWRRDDLATEYPTDEYSVSYAFQSANNATVAENNFTVTGSEDSNGYYFELAGATTLALTDLGEYKWQIYVTRTSDSARVSLGTGRSEIVTDFASENVDARQHAEIMLTKIESILEGRADADVSNYAIAGRSLTKISIPDLLQWRDYYRAEAIRLKREEDIRLGRSTPSTIKVRF